MKITLVFTKSKKSFPIFSWLIRLWTWKSYSHIAYKIQIKDWKPVYYQASKYNVNCESEDIFLKQHHIVKTYEIDTNRANLIKINKICFEQLGICYGILQILGIAIVDVLKLLGIKTKNPFRKGTSCSEVIYTNIIVPLFGEMGYNPDTIKPHHIEDLLNYKGYKNV